MRRHLFAITSVILLLFLIVAMTRYELLKLRVAFADDQISIFREMRRSAGNTSDPHEIAGFLSYTVTYYPSGTKQLMGSALDRMVEAARSDAVAAILVRFRSVTQIDLGDDPAHWLREYQPERAPTTVPATQARQKGTFLFTGSECPRARKGDIPIPSKLFNDIVAAGSSYVCRVKENSAFEVIEERLLSDEALKAGVVRDAVVRMPLLEPERPSRRRRLGGENVSSKKTINVTV